MIPILYRRDETAFTSNGIGRLADCISCTVTEERNGIYECVFTYPVTGELFAEIQEGCIIGVIHDDAKDVQPFDIYAHSAPLDGVVTYYAHHISYRLGNVILKPMSASSCAQALNSIPANTYNPCSFTFWTDKQVSGAWKTDIPLAVKGALHGQEGSILDVYGKGEYEWDKWLVRLYVNRGNDNGVAIRYGVNLTDLRQEYDESNTYNAVVPYWVSSEDDGTVVTLDNEVIVANTILMPWTTHDGEVMEDGNGNIIYFQTAGDIMPVPLDLSEEFDTAPTQQQLKAAAIAHLNSSDAWVPSENITVSFVNLADTEEYKDVKALQRVRLCDRVSVYCGPMNVSAIKMQVIRVVYNVLTERYDQMELGKPKATYSQSIEAKISAVTKDMATRSMLASAISSATDHITGARDSHVVFGYDANGGLQEILVMDTDSVNTATKIWRWNSGGLGYSQNGYNGPYTTAITQDGSVVADFVNTGTLIANIVKAGILSDSNGKNFWNMETGEFSLSATTTVGGSTVDSIAQDKAESAVDTFDNSLNQQSVFDRLTNDGQTQGIYMHDGKIYINATYIDVGELVADLIKGGTLTLGGDNNNNGTLRILNGSGNTIGTWNKDGINVSSGTIEGTKIVISGGVNSLTVKDADGNIPVKIGTVGFILEENNRWSQLLEAKMHDGTLLYIQSIHPQGKDLPYDYVQNRSGATIAIWGDSTNTPFTDCYLQQFGLYVEGVDARSIISSTAEINVDQLRLWRNDSQVYDFRVNMSNGTMYFTGTKSRLVSTDQYSDRLLYCYETPTPMFGDIGEGVMGDDGICYVPLDPVFAQTVTTDQYQVFLQKYGSGECWVKERMGAYFIIEGTPGLKFGWEIKAKQRDYDQLRLDRNDEPFSVPKQTYGEDAAQHLEDVRKEREAA